MTFAEWWLGQPVADDAECSCDPFYYSQHEDSGCPHHRAWLGARRRLVQWWHRTLRLYAWRVLAVAVATGFALGVLAR